MSATTAALPHRVLVVDDKADQRDGIAYLLAAQGMEVSTAGDGQEALHVLGAGLLHCLILLDLNMPVMDGWEFRRRQLLSREWAGIPVLILSGHPELNAVTRTMQAREVWPKPVALNVLLRAVAAHCGGH